MKLYGSCVPNGPLPNPLPDSSSASNAESQPEAGGRGSSLIAFDPAGRLTCG